MVVEEREDQESNVAFEEVLNTVESLQTVLSEFTSELHSYEFKAQEFLSKTDGFVKQRKKLEAEFKSLAETVKGLATRDERKSMNQSIKFLRHSLKKHVEGILPSTNRGIGWILLGNMDLVMPRVPNRINFKQEYENFKWLINCLLMAFCGLCLLLSFLRHPLTSFVETTTCLLGSVAYMIMIVREAILKANGSNIHTWWVWHHYITMTLTAILATWPYDAIYASFRLILFLWIFYAGMVAFLQYRYQSSRLYHLRALDKVPMMEVPSHDTSPHYWCPPMFLLLPFIFIAQLWQLYNGYFLFYASLSSDDSSFHVFLKRFSATLAIAQLTFTVLVCCNHLRYPRFWTTVHRMFLKDLGRNSSLAGLQEKSRTEQTPVPTKPTHVERPTTPDELNSDSVEPTPLPPSTSVTTPPPSALTAPVLLSIAQNTSQLIKEETDDKTASAEIESFFNQSVPGDPIIRSRGGSASSGRSVQFSDHDDVEDLDNNEGLDSDPEGPAREESPSPKSILRIRTPGPVLDATVAK